MECFTVYADEIEGRVDPHFYRSKFRELEEKLRELNHKQLREVIEFSSETWDQKNLFDNEFPYIEISEIDTASGEIQNMTYYKKTKAPSRARMIVRENDIIISTTRPHRGAITLIDKEKDGFIASTGFAILRNPKIEINKKYLLCFLRTQLSLNQMLQRSSGGNYPAITSEELKKLIVPIPKINIQNRIVQIMDDAYEIKKQKETEAQQLIVSIDDYALEELGIKLPELKDEMTFVVYADEIEGRIDPFYYRPGIKEIKKTLEQKHGTHFLGEVIKDIYRYPTFYGIRYVSKGIRVIKGESISKEGIIDDEQEFDYIDEVTHKRFIKTHIKKGDLIFTVRGIIGKIGYYNLNDEANINANVIKIRLINNYNPEFFWIYLNSKIGQLFIDTLSSGQVQKTITVPDIKNIPITLPPLSIQNKIANEVKARMQKAKQLQKEAKEVFKEAKERAERIILGEEEI